MKHQIGLTIVELMVALSIGLFVIGGTYSIFAMSSVSVKSTSHFNQLQDSARMALTMLHSDISQAGYFADLTGIDLIPGVNLINTPSISSNDCVGGGNNNASFPNDVGHFRTLWAFNQGGAQGMACLSGNATGSDVLQLKRLIGPPIAASDQQSDRYYFINNFSQGQFYRGSASAPILTNGRIWAYQHRVYYVSDNDQGVPTLFRRNLTVAEAMKSEEPLVEGVEEVKYEFGIDVDGDSYVDTYLTSDDMSNDLWDLVGANRVIAVRIYLLLRTSSEDDNIQDDADTEFMMPGGTKVVAADNHRRRLLSSTVMLRNPVISVRK